jgi:hypothetical protein
MGRFVRGKDLRAGTIKSPTTLGDIQGGAILADSILSIGDITVVAGNVTADVITGNSFVGVTVSPAGSPNEVQYNNAGSLGASANFTYDGTYGLTVQEDITSIGNVNGNNVVSTNDVTTYTVTATGNITGDNLLTGGLVSATGNVTGGNLTTAGLINATGNITGGNVSGTTVKGGNVSIFNNNIQTNSGVTGITLSIFGADETDPPALISKDWVFGNTGTFTSPGDITATGNVTGGNLTTLGDVTTATVTATGNIDGGNLITSGLLSATGNITGGNITTSGSLTVSGDIKSDSFYFVKRSTNTSISYPGGYGAVTIDYEDAGDDYGSTDAMWDSSTDRFTPTVAGLWYFRASVDCYSGASEEGGVSILKNGSLVTQISHVGAINPTATTHLYMNGTTDYVQFTAYTQSARTRGQSAQKSFFEALLVKQAE